MPFFKKNPLIKQKLIHGLISLLIIICGLSFFWFVKGLNWRYLITLRYFGFAVIAFFGSAIVFLPFPLALFIGVSSLFLNPLIVALLGSAVVSLGTLIPYLAGAEGRIIFKDFKSYNVIHNWITKNTHGFWSVLFFSVIPFPFFDFVSISAGILGVKVRKFLLAIFIGKTISYLVTVALFYYLGHTFPHFWDFLKPYWQ